MAHELPSFADFEQLAQHGNAVPVYCQLLADHLTPGTAFSAISESSPHAFLLESGVGGEKVGRYSFLGADPKLIFEATGSEVTQTTADGTPAQAPVHVSRGGRLLRRGPTRTERAPG